MDHDYSIIGIYSIEMGGIGSCHGYLTLTPSLTLTIATLYMSPLYMYTLNKFCRPTDVCARVSTHISLNP